MQITCGNIARQVALLKTYLRVKNRIIKEKESLNTSSCISESQSHFSISVSPGKIGDTHDWNIDSTSKNHQRRSIDCEFQLKPKLDLMITIANVKFHICKMITLVSISMEKI